MQLYRSPYINTTGSFLFTFLVFILRLISCCHFPYFPVTCNISFEHLPVKMVGFYYLRQFPEVHVYLFPLFTTTSNVCYFVTIHFTFHILMPHAIVPYQLPDFIGTIYIINSRILLLITATCTVWLALSIYLYHW